MNRRNRLRRAALVLALLVLAAIVTGVAESASKTAIPKQLIGRWERANGPVMFVSRRGKVDIGNGDLRKAGYHANFSRVTRHRLSISGPRSCSGTGTYRWNVPGGERLSGPAPLSIKKIHGACKLRVGLFVGVDWMRP